MDYNGKIFKSKTLIFRQFVTYLDSLAEEDKKECYHYYYMKMFPDVWRDLVEEERAFLVKVVEHDWQRFLEYLLENSILGVLRFGLCNGKGDAKLVWLNEKRGGGGKNSQRHFAFNFHLSFETPMKVSVNGLKTMITRKPFFDTDMDAFLSYAEEEQEKEGLENKKKNRLKR